MTALFASTLFLSAALAFLVQPMVAKHLLPVLGGSPAVWTTCLAFFQAGLLTGYVLADRLARLPPTVQVAAHASLVGLAAVSLLQWFQPVGMPSGDPGVWLLARLSTTVGLPFIVLCTTAPLLQSWFARTEHGQIHDAYALYRASNLGSFAGLFAYPLAIEPLQTMVTQQLTWLLGFCVLGAMVLACGLRVRGTGVARPAARLSLTALPTALSRAGRLRRARWVLLAFVPSSLTVGVTAYITADLAAVPLLWVLPLGLYLLSFTVTFGERPLLTARGVAPAFAGTLVTAIALYFGAIGTSWQVTLPVHLLLLLLTAVMCHGQLSDDRPPADQLTAFYIWLAVGGVLGGMFNAIIAPRVFPGYAEYPVVLVLASFLVPRRRGDASAARPTWLDAELAFLAGCLVVVASIVTKRATSPGLFAALAIFGLPAILTLAWRHRRWRFGGAIAAMVVAAAIALPSAAGRVLHRERTFFGVLKVTEPRPHLREMLHGSTVHGRQSQTNAGSRRVPLAYFYPGSPIGQVFAALRPIRSSAAVGVVGLGTGTLAAYARPGDRWRFYEIDSAVVFLARDSRLFSYLTDAPLTPAIVVGDARVSLQAEEDVRFDLLVLDAFSSDAVPVHLLTREALDLYKARLAPGGLVAFHISNRYVDLAPNLGRLAAAIGSQAWKQDHRVNSHGSNRGWLSSQWVVIASGESELLRALVATGRWERLQADGVPGWTDDYSNLVAALRWGA